jgi:3-hydroxyacyl-[acyl-carrier-protein] dehydratase
MAQAGVVALGIYLVSKASSAHETEKLVTVFTDAQVEFSGIVRPGDRVLISGRKLFFRRLKLRSEVEMRLEDGSVVCSGVLSGMGVAR